MLGRLLERQISEVMCLVEVISSASFALGLVIWTGPSVAEVIDQEADEEYKGCYYKDACFRVAVV